MSVCLPTFTYCLFVCLRIQSRLFVCLSAYGYKLIAYQHSLHVAMHGLGNNRQGQMVCMYVCVLVRNHNYNETVAVISSAENDHNFGD